MPRRIQRTIRWWFIIIALLAIAVGTSTRLVALPIAPLPATLMRPLSIAGERLFAIIPPSSEASLRSTIASLEVELSRKNIALKETESLTQLKSVEQKLHRPVIFTHIIGRLTLEFSTLYRIDQGTDDGINVGMAVVAPEGALIGTIQRVSARSADFIPLTNERSRVAARRSDETKTIGVVKGDADIGIRLTTIPRDADIASGQLIVSSNVDPILESGLVIGIIKEIIDEPRQIFKEAVIEPAVLAQDLETVGVIASTR